MIEHFLPLASVVFVSAFTPGPNNIMLMNTGINYGVKKGIPHVLGVVVGFWILVFSSLMGISYIVEQFPQIHTVMRVVGSVYMLYLAYIVSPFNKKQKKTENNTKNGESITPVRIGFLRALLFQFINPKGLTMMLLFPTIVPVQTIQDKIIFMVVTGCITLSSALTWLLGGKLLQRAITNARVLYGVNMGSALLLVLTVVWLYT